MIIASVVTGVLLFLCCGGGLGGFVAFGVYAYGRVKADAVAAVDRYLGDLRAGSYDQAYRQLCAEVRDDRPLATFTARESSAPVRQYRLSDEVGNGRKGGFLVDATVERGTSAPRSESYEVVFEDDNQARICS